MTAQDTKINLPLIAAIVGVATIGGFMFGYDSGAINGTQEGLKTAFNLSEGWLGLTVAALLPGCALGAFMAGRLADTMGRKNVMMVAAVLFIVSALASGAAPSALLLGLARFCAGAAVGAASVLSPAYISEVTPASIRGRLSSVQQIMIIGGLFGAAVANYYLTAWAGTSTSAFWFGYAAWRWMFWVQVAPAILFLLTLLLIPESPRFLVAKKRDAEAEAVLTRLFGAREAQSKVADIKASLAGDHAPKMADLLHPSTGKIRKIVWIGIGLAAFQQLVGINVVFYYSSMLWQAVGFTEQDSMKITVLNDGLSILACLVAITQIDKLGRKPLLMIGSIGMTITLALLSYAFANATFVNGQPQLSPFIGHLAVYSAIAYSILFNFSWGPVMWVMLGEMFPNQMRGSALAVAGAAQWISNFAISMSFPWLAKNIGLPISYGFYTAFAFLSILFVYKMVYETKGRELEDMAG
jgi:MFS transporter, SP family, sugar:H+ symporter